MNNSANTPAYIKERFKFLDETVGFDYILREDQGSDFTEYVTSMGGDVSTYRVYGKTKEEFAVYGK